MPGGAAGSARPRGAASAVIAGAADPRRRRRRGPRRPPLRRGARDSSSPDRRTTRPCPRPWPASPRPSTGRSSPTRSRSPAAAPTTARAWWPAATSSCGRVRGAMRIAPSLVLRLGAHADVQGDPGHARGGSAGARRAGRRRRLAGARHRAGDHGPRRCRGHGPRPGGFARGRGATAWRQPPPAGTRARPPLARAVARRRSRRRPRARGVACRRHRLRRAVRGSARSPTSASSCPTAGILWAGSSHAGARPRRLARRRVARASGRSPTGARTASTASSRRRSARPPRGAPVVARRRATSPSSTTSSGLVAARLAWPRRDDRHHRQRRRRHLLVPAPGDRRRPGVGLPEHFEELFGTPHGIELGPLVAALGAGTAQVDAGTLRAALEASLGAPGVSVLGCGRPPAQRRPARRGVGDRPGGSRGAARDRRGHAVSERLRMRIDGMPWSVRVAGRGHGRCCSCTASGQQPVVERPRRPGSRFRAIVPDLPGHGPSAAGRRVDGAGGPGCAPATSVERRPTTSPASWAASARPRSDVIGYSLGARIAPRASSSPTRGRRRGSSSRPVGRDRRSGGAGRARRRPMPSWPGSRSRTEWTRSSSTGRPSRLLAGESALPAAARARQRAIRRGHDPLGLAASLVFAGQGAMEPLGERLGEVRAAHARHRRGRRPGPRAAPRTWRPRSPARASSWSREPATRRTSNGPTASTPSSWTSSRRPPHDHARLDGDASRLDPRPRVPGHPLRAFRHGHRQGHDRSPGGAQRLSPRDRDGAHRRLRPHPRRRLDRLRAPHRRRRGGVLLGRRPERTRATPAATSAPTASPASTSSTCSARSAPCPSPSSPSSTATRSAAATSCTSSATCRSRPRTRSSGRSGRGSARSTPGSGSACWRASSATRRPRRSGSCAASTAPTRRWRWAS